MNKYTHIAFLSNSKSFIHCVNDLDYKYLESTYSVNKTNKQFNTRQVLAAFETDFIRDNYQYIIPNTLEQKTGFSNKDLTVAIKLAKKEELKIVLAEEYKNFIKNSEDKAEYYKLLEKEAITKVSNKSYDSIILNKIADRKNIKVDTLVLQILNKVASNYNVILNRQFLTNDISLEIDAMSLEQLLEFEVIDEVKIRLYIDNLNEKVETTEELNTKVKKSKTL